MGMIMTRFWVSLVMGILVWVPVLALAAAMPEYTVVIKDHRFDPVQIEVPANTKVKLVIDNQDATPEEFESHDLGRETVIAGNRKAILLIGPLKAGSYNFVGEFHKDTAKGSIFVQ